MHMTYFKHNSSNSKKLYPSTQNSFTNVIGLLARYFNNSKLAVILHEIDYVQKVQFITVVVKR